MSVERLIELQKWDMLCMCGHRLGLHQSVSLNHGTRKEVSCVYCDKCHSFRSATRQAKNKAIFNSFYDQEGDTVIGRMLVPLNWTNGDIRIERDL